MSVYLRSADLLVTKEFLNRSEILVSFQKMRCERVPKHMGGNPTSDSSFFHGSFDRLSNICEGFAGPA